MTQMLLSSALLRTQSDGRLVLLAAEGHERAFEAIFERYRSRCTATCDGCCPPSGSRTSSSRPS